MPWIWSSRTDDPVGLRLVDVAATAGGLSVQTYEVEGSAQTGTYDPEVHTFADRP